MQSKFKIIADLRVLCVMATAHEFTPALAARIEPLITGVGPVEAAAGLAGALGGFNAQACLPHLIVALGSAGSRDLDHAGIYQASSVSNRDMDCSALGFARGVTPFSDDPPVLPLGPAIPGVKTATLSCGAAIINGAAYDTLDADMADMETFAYAHAARRFGVPLISLRGISDGKSALTQLSDWTHTLEEIGNGFCAALDKLEAALAAGALTIAP